MSNIHTESFSNSVNGDVMNGYLTYDSDIDGNGPGFLEALRMVGLNDCVFTSREADVNGEKFGLPVGYKETAEHDSWAAMKDLFDDVF